MRHKFLYLYVTLFILVALVISGTCAYFVTQKNTTLVPYEENLATNNHIKYGLKIEELKQNRLGVRGWAHIDGQKFMCNRTKVVFENSDNGQRIIIPTYTINFPNLHDLEEYKKQFGNEERDAWFLASIKKQRLPPPPH